MNGRPTSIQLNMDRKHRAPKGALRRGENHRYTLRVVVNGQKAPSAKRCIKTPGYGDLRESKLNRQKAPSAKRCIKTLNTRNMAEVTC